MYIPWHFVSDFFLLRYKLNVYIIKKKEMFILFNKNPKKPLKIGYLNWSEDKSEQQEKSIATYNSQGKRTLL